MKAFIIENETLSRDLSKISLQEICPEVTVLRDSSTIKDAFLKINEAKPDIVFLDIEILRGNGVDLLTKFEAVKTFSNCASDCHEYYARQPIKECTINYLLKIPDKVNISNSKINELKEWIYTNC